MNRDRPRCRTCAHFLDDAAAVEAALPGLATLSSAHASVRGADGLCRLHDRFTAAGRHCGAFAALSLQASAVPSPAFRR